MKTSDDSRWNDTSVTESSGNIFVDLGFDPAEAEVMKLRAEVMIRTAQRLKERGCIRSYGCLRDMTTAPAAPPAAKFPRHKLPAYAHLPH